VLDGGAVAALAVAEAVVAIGGHELVVIANAVGTDSVLMRVSIARSGARHRLAAEPHLAAEGTRVAPRSREQWSSVSQYADYRSSINCHI
jgi:hypothetical protein